MALLLWFVVAPVAAAAGEFFAWDDTACDIYDYGKFRPGSTTVTVADTINLRLGPGLNAPVVARLGHWQRVTIVAATDRKLERNGYADYWYRVNVTINDQPLSGYIWGGFLAKINLAGNPGEETSHLNRVSAWFEGRSKGELRLVVNSSYPYMFDWQIELSPIGAGIDGGATYNYSLRGELFEDVPGFDPPLSLVKLTFEYGACDYPNGDVWLVLGDPVLWEAFRAVGQGNEFGSLWFEYVFPSDTGGEANQLIVRYTRTTAADEEHPEIRESKTWDEVYLWDGQRLALRGDTAARND